MSLRKAVSLRYALQGHMPRLARALVWLRQDIGSDVLLAPLEPILHASKWRLGWIGVVTLIGHPLFGWIWSYWQPQPWESMSLRFAVGALGIVLLILAFHFDPFERITQIAFNVVWWVELPLLFSWMYLCNGGNSVWLASTVGMILIYYEAVDWRFATVGVALGAVLAWLLFITVGPSPHDDNGFSQTNVAVLLFIWCCAIVLGFSTANQRRLHLRRTLTTVGIMAHELRTPLATVTMISQALQRIAQTADGPNARSIEPLATRLAALANNMNHQIDMQIVNARMLRLTPMREPIGASHLVQQTIGSFPFRNAHERRAVELQVTRDFVFQSSPALFTQVFENLLKNAFKALAATGASLSEGDIAIEITTQRGKGRLIFSDRGIGMTPALRHRIFEPFFSSDSHSGHGLGLAFCKRVVNSAGGSIRVHSEPGKGAAFIIDLPLAR